jgi:hypothetical protein
MKVLLSLLWLAFAMLATVASFQYFVQQSFRETSFAMKPQ